MQAHPVCLFCILTKFLAKTLIRGGFCCVVTGYYDSLIAEKNKELEQKAKDEKKGFTDINCAHIFAESANANISGDNKGSNKLQSPSPILMSAYA